MPPVKPMIIDSDIKILYVVTGKPVALRMAILSIFS
jgi:hypothetical protein